MKFLHEILAQKYSYKKLPESLSNIVQSVYASTLPEFLNHHQPLYTLNGTCICNDFERIVIGDYGAYVEYSPAQANKDNYIIAPGQEYRLEPRYSNVKYIWLTISDDSDIKIYYQKHPVTYADYKPEYYYVSVYEVYPAILSLTFSEN